MPTARDAALLESFKDPVDFSHLSAGQAALQLAQLRCVRMRPHPLASRTLRPATRTVPISSWRNDPWRMPVYPGYSADEDPTMRRWSLLTGCVTEREPSIDDMKLVLKAHHDRSTDTYKEIVGLRIITFDKDVCFELIGACGSYFLTGCRTDGGKRHETYETLKMLFEYLSEAFDIRIEDKHLGPDEGPVVFGKLQDAWNQAMHIRNSPPDSPLRRPWLGHTRGR